jgi:hypothetical protein
MEAQGFVETDLALPDVLSLIPAGLRLEPRLIQSFYIGPNAVQNLTTAQGAQVLRPIPDEIRPIVEAFYIPPTQNRLVQEQATIALVNQSGRPDLEFVVQAILEEFGFQILIVESSIGDEVIIQDSQVVDFTGNTKGSSLNFLARRFQVQGPDIIILPDPNRTVDYRISIGQTFNACASGPRRG